MPTSSVTHTQTRSVVAGPLYRVEDEVTASTNIDDAVFVYKQADATFDRVATVLDMSAYPDNLVDATNGGLSYYRQPTVLKDFSSVAEAQDFADTLVSRMTSLCLEYDVVTTEFEGEDADQVLPPA